MYVCMYVRMYVCMYVYVCIRASYVQCHQGALSDAFPEAQSSGVWKCKQPMHWKLAKQTVMLAIHP